MDRVGFFCIPSTAVLAKPYFFKQSYPPKHFFSGIAHCIWRSALSHANKAIVSSICVTSTGAQAAEVEADAFHTDPICKRK